MASERFKAVIDVTEPPDPPITRLVERLHHEIAMGYYDSHMGADMLKKVLKWATKYRDGDS